MNTKLFASRHIGISEENLSTMFKTIGVESMEQLIYETIPDEIRLKSPLGLPKNISEQEFLGHMQELSEKNKVFKTYIGLGYHESLTPSVIKRNILENPGWYTAYTHIKRKSPKGIWKPC